MAHSNIAQSYVSLIESGSSSPIERAEIGRKLSEIGDPRKGVGNITINHITLPDIVWCHIPTGEFMMGFDGIDELEEPSHSVYLPDFYMSRYLVTYKQYRMFENAPDFHEAHWWDDYPDEQKYQKVDQTFKYDNHPCEGVSWYMATAFCRWLTHHWNMAKMPFSVWDMITKSYQEKAHQPIKIGLPSEAEYEKMVRGTDGRMLPYGDDDIENDFGFDPNKANTFETGIGMTTAVGLFPDGASPYGVLDGIGNVETWTRSQPRGYPYQPDDGREDMVGKSRITRGGSWKGDASYAYASHRGDGISAISKQSWLGFFVMAHLG